MKITNPKIYLAGPDVFFPNADEIKEAKRKIAENQGIIPLFPLDNVVRDLFFQKSLTKSQKGLIISKANEILMDKADGIIANITPYNGPSLDVGTAVEIGYMRKAQKPIECYTNSPVNFLNRVKSWLKSQNIETYKDKFSAIRDNKHNMMLEDFGDDIVDNIMVDGAYTLSGGGLSKPLKKMKDKDLYKSLEQFERAVKRMVNGFRTGLFEKESTERENALKPYLANLQ